MFDIEDLEDKISWLKTLSEYIEWEYSLAYQEDIDGIIQLLEEMKADYVQ